MRPNCCHSSLAFLLKFLNFLQAFIGVSIIIYSIWMLDQWNNHIPISPPPAASSPDSSSLSLLSNPETASASRQIASLRLVVELVSGLDGGHELNLQSFQLPAPWFIYSFMGVGILLCFVTFIGWIAAETINGCCLCFYTVLKTIIIMLEAALVAFIAIDHHWEKDLPFDPTGDLQSFRSFVEDNVEIFKWVGISVVVIQALSLLLAIVLRAMVSTRKADHNDEDDFEIRGRTREPLLNSQSSYASGSIKSDGRGTHSDIWSSRIRDKYGLNPGENYNPLNQNASRSMKSS